MQPPLTALVCRWSYIYKCLSTGGACPCGTLCIRQECAYLMRFSKFNKLYFLKIWQWWWYVDFFLSRTLRVCLYRKANGLRVVLLAWDQVVKQYVIWEKIIECISHQHIIAASVNMTLQICQICKVKRNSYKFFQFWKKDNYQSVPRGIWYFWEHLKSFPCNKLIWLYTAAISLAKKHTYSFRYLDI